MAEWVAMCTTQIKGRITELGVRRVDKTFGMDRKSSLQVIADIKAGNIYHVRRKDGPRIIVVNHPRGKYLRSLPDNTTTNNLDNLPPCQRRRN